jgi:hypothetical protein
VSLLRCFGMASRDGEAEARCMMCGARFFSGEGTHVPGCEGFNDLDPETGSVEDNETTK